MKLPDLHNALLDEATLDQLFDDIASCTRTLAVIPKFADRRYVPNASICLDDARTMLREDEVAGVPLRYEYHNIQWWDTLMVTPAGTRLVRIQHDFQ